MPTTETHSYRFVSAFSIRMKQQANEMPIHGYCYFCDETFKASLAEVRAWHEAHRAEKHPDAKDRGQAKRRQAANAAPRVFVPGRGPEVER